MNPLQIRNTLTSTFSKRLEVKPNEKKQIVLNGSLLRPLSVGRGALLHAGGNIYHTSRVVTILEESEDCVRFETQNSHYHLSMSPFPLAAVSPLPVRLAACA
mgnify:CR=1 FL=1